MSIKHRLLPISLMLLIFLVSSFKLRNDPPWQKETKNKPLKILVISDLNASYGSTTYPAEIAQVVERIATIKPDLILCGGDMVAGQKASLTDENIKAMWQNFDASVLKPIQQMQIPFGFTLGNHDASPGFVRERAIAKTFWLDDANQTGLTFVDSSHFPFYFSYIKNNVFIMSWDASASKVNPEVYTWMEAQLKSKVAKKARLRMLIGHLPLYAIVEAKNKPGEVNADADGALQFFKDNGLDLYISGHQHAYFPAQKNGVQLLNLGAIGDGPRPILGHSAPAQKAYTVFEVPIKQPKKLDFMTYQPATDLPIPINSLPDSVTGFNGTIKRIDQKNNH